MVYFQLTKHTNMLRAAMDETGPLGEASDGRCYSGRVPFADIRDILLRLLQDITLEA